MKAVKVSSSGSGKQKDNAPKPGQQKSLTWHQMPNARGSWKPPPRQGHTSQVIDEKLYVFGGLETSHRTNSLCVLDLGQRIWENLNPSGERPCARSSCASWVFEKRLFIQGGETDDFSVPLPSERPATAASTREARKGLSADQDKLDMAAGGRVCVDDVYMYDPPINKWSKVVTRLAPLPRRMHSIVLGQLDGTPHVVLFGGLQGGTRGPSNDVYLLALDENFWKGKGVWFRMLSKGQQPCPRYGHSSTALSSSMMVVFGGKTHAGDLLNDIYILDIPDKTWSSIAKTIGKPPSGRWGHQACLCPLPGEPHKSGVLIYGGASSVGRGLKRRRTYSHELFMFDPHRYRWSDVQIGHAFPASRFGHSLAWVQGWKPARLWFDGRVVDKDEEDEVDPSQEVTKCRAFALVFGGINAMYCTSDTWMLELRWRTRVEAASTYVDSLPPVEVPVSSGASSAGNNSVSAAAGEYWISMVKQAKLEGSIAQRELLRETRKRLAVQKKYDDLEKYCSTLQGQVKHFQESAEDTSKRLLEALSREQSKVQALEKLLAEAYSLIGLLELSAATSWGPVGAGLLAKAPELQERLTEAAGAAKGQTKANAKDGKQTRTQQATDNKSSSVQRPKLSVVTTGESRGHAAAPLSPSPTPPTNSPEKPVKKDLSVTFGDSVPADRAASSPSSFSNRAMPTPKHVAFPSDSPQEPLLTKKVPLELLPPAINDVTTRPRTSGSSSTPAPPDDLPPALSLVARSVDGSSSQPESSSASSTSNGSSGTASMESPREGVWSPDGEVPEWVKESQKLPAQVLFRVKKVQETPGDMFEQFRQFYGKPKGIDAPPAAT